MLLQNWAELSLLDDEEYRVLRAEKARIACVYLLPKLHKNSEVPPGRPIVSSNESFLEMASKYINYVLLPFVLDLR